MHLRPRIIILALAILAFGTTLVAASEQRIVGVITKVDCGDGTNMEVLRNGGKRISGVCYEKWCEELCGERREQARERMVGRRISASIRVVNTEEPEFGALANELFNFTLE